MRMFLFWSNNTSLTTLIKLCEILSANVSSPAFQPKFATQHFSSSPPNWKLAASGKTGADAEGDKVGELCAEPRGDHVGDAKGDANGELKSLWMVAAFLRRAYGFHVLNPFWKSKQKWLV